MNQLFPFNATTEQFATMIYGVLDAGTGEFRYVSAGHPGPVHLPAGAAPVILESTGSPIGLAEDAYGERSVRLAAGDRLYLYSDGVAEAMNPGGELFGYARALEAIGQGQSVPLQESVAALVDEIERWRGAASAEDDISILAVEVPLASGPGGPGVVPLAISHDTRGRNEPVHVASAAPTVPELREFKETRTFHLLLPTARDNERHKGVGGHWPSAPMKTECKSSDDEMKSNPA